MGLLEAIITLGSITVLSVFVMVVGIMIAESENEEEDDE